MFSRPQALKELYIPWFNKAEWFLVIFNTLLISLRRRVPYKDTLYKKNNKI